MRSESQYSLIYSAVQQIEQHGAVKVDILLKSVICGNISHVFDSMPHWKQFKLPL